jgi:hypothetical protein
LSLPDERHSPTRRPGSRIDHRNSPALDPAGDLETRRTQFLLEPGDRQTLSVQSRFLTSDCRLVVTAMWSTKGLPELLRRWAGWSRRNSLAGLRKQTGPIREGGSAAAAFS